MHSFPSRKPRVIAGNSALSADRGGTTRPDWRPPAAADRFSSNRESPEPVARQARNPAQSHPKTHQDTGEPNTPSHRHRPSLAPPLSGAHSRSTTSPEHLDVDPCPQLA